MQQPAMDHSPAPDHLRQTPPKPYRVQFWTGGRQWFPTLAAAQKASKHGTAGVIAVWTGTSWAE